MPRRATLDRASISPADGVSPPIPSAWQSSTRAAPASSAMRTPAASWTAISTGRGVAIPTRYLVVRRCHVTAATEGADGTGSVPGRPPVDHRQQATGLP